MVSFCLHHGWGKTTARWISTGPWVCWALWKVWHKTMTCHDMPCEGNRVEMDQVYSTPNMWCNFILTSIELHRTVSWSHHRPVPNKQCETRSQIIARQLQCQLHQPRSPDHEMRQALDILDSSSATNQASKSSCRPPNDEEKKDYHCITNYWTWWNKLTWYNIILYSYIYTYI